ncbi:MAG: transposase [Deltaproteobacteria bacterium]|nr:transposase [Deltaproteobacteria bacterium]MBW1847400.1 transposase [Deltaproteobacteria bacterium]MBW2363822.1 transposase [Deltaproteobacteria bacterium]
MARAKRHYLSGHVWHITHRCHKREFLLKFARDRRRWIEWLFQAKKRYGLNILNYMVTSNHVHLLVFDNDGKNVIPDTIKLTAGRVAQEYNNRKGRKGAFWEDRYHATAVETNHHLIRCITYIDLNMVRAGVVNHPSEWECCGYNEVQNPKARKGVIDFSTLMNLLDIENVDHLKETHHKWVDSAIPAENHNRESKWTQSIAVGSKSFVENIKEGLGFRAKGRKVIGSDDMFELRENPAVYGNTSDVSDNAFFWDQ